MGALDDLLMRPPPNPVTPTLNQLYSGARTAGNVAHSAVVEPVQEMGRGLSDLMAGRGVTPDVGAGLMAAMGLMTPMKAGVLTKGIRAYHGSPHKFDKFSLDKIGTGEGAQAYGHGLYFAENEQVAKMYRDQVKDMAMLNANNKRMTEIAREMDKLKVPGSYRKFRDPHGYALADEYDRLMEQKMAPGHMYEVNINARPEQFLDYDQMVTHQTEPVREALNRAGIGPVVENLQLRSHDPITDAWGPSYKAATGRDVYQTLMYPGTTSAKPDSVKASQVLREAGIPGIKYLDQGSRTAGEGSSNYVVFDDSLIDILKRYALMGGAAAPVLAGAGDQQ